MHHFHRKRGALHVEDVKLDDLAARFGTPLYVYSAQTLLDHFHGLRNALSDLDHMVCYAMKANSNLAVLRLLAREGSGFDIVSGGELFRVLKAGGRADRCVFAGVGKTADEIAYALREGIYCFNVESEGELSLIDKVAARLKKKAPIAVRVNPNVDADTHAKITTGTYENKFGIPYEDVPALYERAAKMKNIHLRGVQIHIGSQITSVQPFRAAVQKLIPLVVELRDRHGIESFDIGGGLGIVYEPAFESGARAWWAKHRRPPMTPRAYAGELVPLLKDLKMKVLVEPGRFIAGNAGVLLTEVLNVKATRKKNFVIVDAAMNDLIRPAFYDSYHEIVPLGSVYGEPVKTDVVGPICESGDIFCKDRPLPPFRPGERLAFLSTGAYGFVMASNYNSRPMAAEVLVHGTKVLLARKRQTYDDLIVGERAK